MKIISVDRYDENDYLVTLENDIGERGQIIIPVEKAGYHFQFWSLDIDPDYKPFGLNVVCSHHYM